MFKDFINQKVLVHLKSEENKNYWSSGSIECTLLDYDTRFLKLSVDSKTHYFNIDSVRVVTLSENQ